MVFSTSRTYGEGFGCLRYIHRLVCIHILGHCTLCQWETPREYLLSITVIGRNLQGVAAYGAFWQVHLNLAAGLALWP